jgi:hypothetical protein
LTGLRRTTAVVLLAVTVLAGSACESGSGTDVDVEPAIELDGSPRFPDDQGIATDMTVDEITLDGARTYPVSPRLQSFSTSTMELEPFRKRRGQYILVGLEGGEIVWVGAVAGVVRHRDGASVYYTGTLIDRRERDLIFDDGTVLRAAVELDVPVLPVAVRARIDAAAHEVVELR